MTTPRFCFLRRRYMPLRLPSQGHIATPRFGVLILTIGHLRLPSKGHIATPRFCGKTWRRYMPLRPPSQVRQKSKSGVVIYL